MSAIERLRPNESPDPDPDPEYLSLADAGPMLEALASETAQSVMVELDREPAAAADVADRVGTSLQNVTYHLAQLEEAGLVTTAGTRYSEKGREMEVYAPAVSALVIGGTSAPGDTT